MDPDDAGGRTADFLAVMLDPLAVAFHWIQMMQGLEVLPMDPDDAGGRTAVFLAVILDPLAVAFHWIQMMQGLEVLPFVPMMAVMGVPF